MVLDSSLLSLVMSWRKSQVPRGLDFFFLFLMPPLLSETGGILAAACTGPGGAWGRGGSFLLKSRSDLELSALCVKKV